jgi:hypothetical protein
LDDLASRLSPERWSGSFPLGPVLMVIEAQVDENHGSEFNRWYDEQHLPGVVACPGILGGARYRSSDAKLVTYVAIYVLADESAVDSGELKAISGFGHLAPHVSYVRRLYRPMDGAAIKHADVGERARK